MIRFARPNPPKVLLEAGAEETQRMCRDFERDPDFRLGNKRFDFDLRKDGKALYNHEEVKTPLLAAQHGKCAFCESKITPVSYGTIEHFRPKGGFQQREGDELEQPGYYWLAYRWENLFFACQICNEKHKRNLFPLLNPSKRARSHFDDLSLEKPALIDASREEPSEWLQFNPNRPEELQPRNRSRRGSITIRVFGLNRIELLEIRREDLKVFESLLATRDLLREDSRPEREEYLQEIEDLISDRLASRSAYSAMCQARLESWKRT
jgi:uncharacterized protein (TIGR02646 family)